jgi:8-oxo-dGTP pyrophosphatase MutT (NUDIX family)
VGDTRPATVRAAGGLVFDGQSILLVHRPSYDDWTLPKGKLERDESWEDAALREVREETGLRCRIVAPEPFVTRYRDRKDRSKEVRYFRMERTSGAFIANDEVDRVRWCPIDEAPAWLSYDSDRGVVRDLTGRAS